MSENLSSKTLVVSGVPEGVDAQWILRELDQAPVVVIARDDKRLAALQRALTCLAPDVGQMVFPAWDCVPFDRMSPNADISAMRMTTLAALSHGIPTGVVVLTTVNAFTQKVPARALIAQSTFVAHVGQRIDEAALRNKLVYMGFSQSPTVMEPGDFAIRGGLIDIFPPGQEGPVRLDLFGDVLDGARRFDPETQRSGAAVKTIEIAPVSEVILDAASIRRFRQSYRIEFGAAGRDDPLYEAISAGRKQAGMEHWLPFFHAKLDAFVNYTPGATLIFDDQVQPSHAAKWDGIQDQYETRLHALTQKGRIDSVYKPCPPDLLYLDEATLQAATSHHRKVQFSVLPQPVGLGSVDAGGRLGRSFAPERKLENINLFETLASHIHAKRVNGQVVIASWSDGARDRLSGLLHDHGIGGTIDIKSLREVPDGAGDVFLIVWALETGYETEGLTVISEQDVLGDRLIRAPRKKKRAENFLQETSSLSQNDLIVHVDHGVGRYIGLETVTAMGAPHECLHLEYSGGDRLYLPVENIELLSRYGQENGLLDKLGGGAWQAKKARLKERIREMADKLIRIAAERALRSAPILEPPRDMWEEFAARFPYQETDDQLSAIEDVIADMASGHPMDRLICGDVGFGKTEVAMRAAFAAALSGVQVAVIAPTTLLARQHSKSFRDRFRGFPIEIRSLSRFSKAKEAAETRSRIAAGSVDIVVGTHALLAKTVRFANLGLLIIDEEQHFGVTHKERLKEMRTDIHVLTLTATPIPRTLQLSLSGVRDLSIIGTPPVDRLSIRTYVSEFDAITLREALLREHYRGGQSFFVVPRISDLPEIESFMRDQVPEVSFITAHGQMSATALDDRMNAFYDGKYDVLLATTIVESGLDIPTANTMIVHKSDMFGLSQLYQIRGRVGRSKTRAYAYLTTKPRMKLTQNAEKRLRVLGSLDSLGAGFTLASQDLDIRGAGNLLGEEQSGQFREVGFELYQTMLEEAVAKMKSGKLEGLTEADDQWAPQINLGVPVLIPAHYVADLDVRLGLYRRLSHLSSKVELEGFAAELIDRFGKLPKEINTLLVIVRIKAMCKRAGIGRFDAGPKGATIQFHNNKFANPAGLVSFVNEQDGLAKIKDNKVIVRRDWTKESDKIKGAFSIARDLAGHAKNHP